MRGDCAELKLRAERKAGEMLAGEGFGRHGGDRKSSDTASLDGLGIAKHQSSRWQRIASLPEGEFEAYIAEAVDNERELTTS